MSRKLEFMFPDIKTAHYGWREMLLACIDNQHIHFLVRPGTALGALQPASQIDSTDVVHSAERGIPLGAGLGLLAGLMALAFPPWYTHTYWPLILTITTVIGALFGGIGMALLGQNLSNSDHDNVKKRIAQGEVLMIVDVPKYRENEIRQIVAQLLNLNRST